jgi:hypothetical protein
VEEALELLFKYWWFIMKELDVLTNEMNLSNAQKTLGITSHLLTKSYIPYLLIFRLSDLLLMCDNPLGSIFVQTSLLKTILGESFDQKDISEGLSLLRQSTRPDKYQKVLYKREYEGDIIPARDMNADETKASELLLRLLAPFFLPEFESAPAEDLVSRVTTYPHAILRYHQIALSDLPMSNFISDMGKTFIFIFSSWLGLSSFKTKFETKFEGFDSESSPSQCIFNLLLNSSANSSATPASYPES